MIQNVFKKQKRLHIDDVLFPVILATQEAEIRRITV
jgi:hypothetical protein